jgi:hypothetical protein
MAKTRRIKYKKKQPLGRIPTAPGTIVHKDKSKYTRRRKHKNEDTGW